jgi:hypothetical protein
MNEHIPFATISNAKTDVYDLQISTAPRRDGGAEISGIVLQYTSMKEFQPTLHPHTLVHEPEAVLPSITLKASPDGDKELDATRSLNSICRCPDTVPIEE